MSSAYLTGLTTRLSAIAIDPPRPRMPPLNALKAFEAAARHASFARAAEELGVTPAAVSHQVKALEAWLGAPLFVRRAQGLGLSDLGRSTLPALSAGFDALGRAVQEMRSASPRAQVDIAALPAIAQLWLAPRLSRVRAAFPRLSPSVHAVETPPDLRRELFDLAIFYVRDAPPGCRMVGLCDDLIFPACAPWIAEGLASPADLAAVPLLRDTTWTGDWACWLEAASAEGLSADGGPAFSLYSMAVQAALDGTGVLMAHKALIGGHLASGALVAPFKVVARTGSQLAILAPERASGAVVGLVEWLVERG
jgi:LysR family glycine cleavage system transcriptional activator